jgi:RHS repeat-associated protein
LHFQLTDWLGTRRAQTDIAGDIEETYTSLPYGDSFATQVANSAPPTADDATEHHFTGKERDAESGNDYFGARYYASSMGRFMSPDWSAEVEPVPYAKLDDPQSLNLYSYMRNNPLKGTDPDGHSPDWWQKFVNWMAGNGSYTDAELAQHRQWLMDHAKDKKSKDAVNGLTDQQVTQLYECGQNAGCMAQQNANRQAVEQAAAQAAAALLPDGLSRDATGKIHGDIPDQVPDNWTKEELKETESELKESIQRRKGEQQQLGEEGGHRERIRREEQLLRQVQKKLSGS